MSMQEATDPVEQLYELCKAQAAVDGAFAEPLMRAWFSAAFELCADMAGLVYPARQIREPLFVNRFGNYVLSQRPSGPVEIFEGYRLITVLPRPLDRVISCFPSLCCLCHPFARYSVGQDLPCAAFSPRFVQAVARLFTYIVENRGDSELDREVLAKCGALTFLGPELQYVA